MPPERSNVLCCEEWELYKSPVVVKLWCDLWRHLDVLCSLQRQINVTLPLGSRGQVSSLSVKRFIAVAKRRIPPNSLILLPMGRESGAGMISLIFDFPQFWKAYIGYWLQIGYPINDTEKRAFWIDGNIHAREWASSHTALFFINQVFFILTFFRISK